jgi:cytochrome c-type biogenesis protein CcmE
MAQSVTTSGPIPAELAGRSTNKNLKFIVGGFLLIGIVIFLIVQATMSTGAYYLTVTEIQESNGALVGQRVRASGQVVDGSEDWDPQSITLRFKITDDKGAQLPIVFFGPRPDNFQRAAEAIVEGTMLPDGSFQANDLLLKCPSRYEEEPEEIHVQSAR